MNLALIYMEQNKRDEAEKYCLETLRLAPEDAKANYNMGIIMSYKQNAEEAANYYRKTAAIDPNHHSALALLIRELQYVCDWNCVKELWPEVKQQAEEQIEAVDTLISQGNLPEIDKYKLTGCIVHIRTSISGLNDEAATTYAEFRPRKAA